MYIKMNNYTISAEKIAKDGYEVDLENTYSQAKRTNTLQMVKVLIGKVYTVSVKLINITSTELRQIQSIALNPEINVQFYDDAYAHSYVTQNMYCPTLKAKAKIEKNGKIYYDEIELRFIGNYAAD